ncbi:glycosyltransferase family 25 protein [Actinocorallia sp. API 0066]|uniref:glycosyltransferase family 25 protein n=1 Tax=Actinocorallia sp. API 0066 TaxID=2896846 RepID=UPI001E5F48E1|nr:glycosyltransferase family 25 protein [Actinocorallia sp. API 0066]MCD0452552.1 glycosyltransferase family 25 protein [Actinocorallia sp. API 0066]
MNELVRTYVVNLRRRPDRRQHMEATIPDILRATYTSDWSGPYDGRQLSLEGLERAGYRLFPWKIESDNPWWGRPLKFGEIACTLAHLACWQDADGHPEPYVLILEDDATFAGDFVPRFQNLLEGLEDLPFDLLYLGRFPLEPDQSVKDGVVSPGYSHCTFGYLLSRPGLDKVLSARLDQAVVPVDEFLPSRSTSTIPEPTSPTTLAPYPTTESESITGGASSTSHQSSCGLVHSWTRSPMTVDRSPITVPSQTKPATRASSPIVTRSQT